MKATPFSFAALSSSRATSAEAVVCRRRRSRLACRRMRPPDRTSPDADRRHCRRRRRRFPDPRPPRAGCVPPCRRSRNPSVRLGSRPVVDRHLVSLRLEVTRHRIAHDAEPQESNLRHRLALSLVRRVLAHRAEKWTRCSSPNDASRKSIVGEVETGSSAKRWSGKRNMRASCHPTESNTASAWGWPPAPVKRRCSLEVERKVLLADAVVVPSAITAMARSNWSLRTSSSRRRPMPMPWPK